MHSSFAHFERLATEYNLILTMTSTEDTRVLDFMKIFLITSHEQRLAILAAITKSQCAILRQVAYNVLFNDSLEISQEDRLYLKRHHTTLKHLASRRICLDTKKAAALRKHLLIKRLAEITVKYLQ